MMLNCHLRKYARNPLRASVSPQAESLSSVEIVVDKMHMRRHTDPWCKAKCDPHKFEKLKKVLIIILSLLLYSITHYIHQCTLIQKYASKYFLGYQDIPELHKRWINILFSFCCCMFAIFTIPGKSKSCKPQVFLDQDRQKRKTYI